jgi:hypothetical protein
MGWGPEFWGDKGRRNGALSYSLDLRGDGEILLGTVTTTHHAHHARCRNRITNYAHSADCTGLGPYGRILRGPRTATLML